MLRNTWLLLVPGHASHAISQGRIDAHIWLLCVDVRNCYILLAVHMVGAAQGARHWIHQALVHTQLGLELVGGRDELFSRGPAACGNVD